MINRQQQQASGTTGRGWAFIGQAAGGDNSWRGYALALVAIVVIPAAIAFALVMAGGNGLLAALIRQDLPIIAASGIVLWAIERLHRRPWRSVISADQRLDARRLVIGAAVQLAIMFGQLLLVDALTGWRLDLSIWLPGTAIVGALCLVPLQAAGEEILFRGYLTQALGRVVRSRIAIAVLVAIIFGALHLNTRGGLTTPYFLVLSLFFSLVSLRDEGLELAIGGHTAMNLFAFAAANSAIVAPGAIGDAPSGAMPLNGAAIGVVFVDGALFYGLTRLGVRLFCRPR